MALKKTKELLTGISGDYFVAETYNDMDNKRTNVMVLLYKDIDARRGGRTYIEKIQVGYIDGVYLDGEHVYNWIKTQPDFIDCVDC